MTAAGHSGKTSALLRVAVVEDEPLFRALLCQALEQSGRVQLRGAYGTAQDARQYLRAGSVQVALLDIDLGGESGIDLGQELRGRDAALGVVLLSNHAHLAFARDLIQARLSGWAYLLKRSVQDVQTIVRALDGVTRGEVVLDPGLMDDSADIFTRFVGLTPRQREVWALITQGYSNGAMALSLRLTPKSVENLVGSLYAALEIDTQNPGINARVQAALLYAQAMQGAHVHLLRPNAGLEG